MKNLVALVDCNNFFVSCERIFRPDLEEVPVIVLSANDGCVIARSNEVKAIGIKMGEPLFKIKELVEKHNIKLFSTNFQIYGEISNRVMSILSKFTPKIEIYSIDEAFLSLDLEGLNTKDAAILYCMKIVKTVFKHTGIPISIGISNTKTLAKIASKYAKKDKTLNGVMFIDPHDSDNYLRSFDIKDIWGVGRKNSKKLKEIGINDALTLKTFNTAHLKKLFGIQIERVILELQGINCYTSDSHSQTQKKHIMRSRSFGQLVNNINVIRSAITKFVSQASKDLRKNNEICWSITVYIRTDIFNTKSIQYSNQFTIGLSDGTNDTIELNKIAQTALTKIFKSGYKYKKAGVLLSNITPEINQQMTFNSNLEQIRERAKLMKAFDKLNEKFGSKSLGLASELNDVGWQPKSLLRSPEYLSKWDELPIVK